MKCYECKWLDRSVVLTSNPPRYGCTLGFGSHYADHECEYDFMPVKHGKWEHWGSPFSDDAILNSIVCSICGSRFTEHKEETFNFCPNCGAKMDKGGDTE